MYGFLFESLKDTWWISVVICLLERVPAFGLEPITRIVYFVMNAAISTVIFLVICWLISWIPPLNDSKILTLEAVFLGVLLTALLNSITGRMTDIEFAWGSIALMAVFSVGLFLPRDRITRLMSITIAGGFGLPVVWIITLASFQAMHLNVLVFWGFVMLMTAATAVALIPRTVRVWIEKRVKQVFALSLAHMNR